MICVNGRGFRQLQRLFLSIYRSNHVYIFHVDLRSEYLDRELRHFLQPYPNVHFTSFRVSSIWGSSDLHDILIRGMTDLLPFEWYIYIYDILMQYFRDKVN